MNESATKAIKLTKNRKYTRHATTLQQTRKKNTKSDDSM